MSSLHWALGFLAGAFIASIAITYIGITMWFRIPFTELLMGAKVLKKGKRVLETLRISSLLLGFVYVLSFTVIALFVTKALWGFTIGSVALTVIGIREWGWTTKNLHNYLANYGHFIDKDANLMEIVGDRLPIMAIHKGGDPEHDTDQKNQP